MDYPSSSSRIDEVPNYDSSSVSIFLTRRYVLIQAKGTLTASPLPTVSRNCQSTNLQCYASSPGATCCKQFKPEI